MIFIDNKYLHIYNSIIDRAKSRGKIDVYTEKHHILPRSLGGTNDLDNLVHLTGREHFIAHRLLVKITTDDNQNKMIFALNCMMNRYNDTMDRYTPTSKVYEYLRIKLSDAHKRMGRTEEHKAAISKAHTGKIVSADTRRRQSEAVKAAGQAGILTDKLTDQIICGSCGYTQGGAEACPSSLNSLDSDQPASTRKHSCILSKIVVD